MNKDQAKGRMKDLAGKAQEKLGQAAGSTEQQAKGLAKQAAGKLQRGMGDIRNAARNATKEK